MGLHRIRYTVNPLSACPVDLLSPQGWPATECEVDTDFVSLCAMGEIFQTGPTASPLSVLFDELLAPNQQRLIWKGAGPGRGVEMRRAFSGLFGRFFARAYLQRYHGFTWFVPIDNAPLNISQRARLVRAPGKSTELPDWICAGQKQIAIAEAKGSHQAANATARGMPGPIKTASGQIQSVALETKQYFGGRERWVSRSLKGWAVMSRWGVEEPTRDAFQYVLDPDTSGEPLSALDRDEIVQDLARMHIGQILAGMGYQDLAPDFGDRRFVLADRARVTVGIDLDGESVPTYLGSIVGPFGVLPVSLAEARSMAASMPASLAQQLRFVGLDIDVIQRMQGDTEIVPRHTREASEGIRIGADSLLFAPLDRVVPRAATI